MRAAYYREKGPARSVLNVGEVETPEPGPGEVRVRVAVSGVNPSDVRTRSGAYVRPVTFPLIIPHNDGAGVIDRVGPDVPADRLGQRVWLLKAQYLRPFGTAAEYVVVPADCAVPLPDAVDFAAGACLGVPALTAYVGVTTFGPVEGLTVLVQGGAGAVGHYAVQMARAKGATVIATVSSDGKAAHARAAGADHIVNYRTEDVPDRIKALTGGNGAERLVEVDISANGPTYAGVLAKRAKVAVYGSGDVTATIPARPFIGMEPTIRFYNVYQTDPEPLADAISEVTSMLEAGTLIHSVARRYPLERIVEAHEAVESGEVMGNVVVDVATLDRGGSPRAE